MEPFQRNRFDILAQFAGSRFSGSAAQKPVIINLINLQALIALRQLVSKAPRSMVTSKDERLLPVAKDMQAWMDRAIAGMKLLESFRICAMNALTGPIAMMKVGVEHVGDIDLYETTHMVGQPYAFPVDPDDSVVDMTSNRWECMRYVGNRYPVSLEEAKEDKMFDKDAREALYARENRNFNEMGNPRVSTLSQSLMADQDDDLEDMCEFWDIWLAKEKLLITLPYNAQGGLFTDKPLRVVEWTGPAEGPYRNLSYCDLPNSVMSPGPLTQTMEMHDRINRAWRKMWRQIERYKKNIGFGGAAGEDVAAYNRANDGDAFKMNHPDLVKELMTGGVDPQIFQVLEQCRQIFSWLAGNLDTQGGLSPQAGTLGQEELLSKSSSMQMAEMQDRTWNFSHDVCKDLFRHWWENPILYYEAVRQAASGDTVPVSITPEMRQMPFDRLDFEIDMYSMQHETPATRLAGIQQIVQQSIMPMMQTLAPQGYTLDGEAFVETIARYGNFPDLLRILKKGPPPDQQGPLSMAKESADEARMPPNTTRTYQRVSRPGTTDRGQSQIMQQLAAGGRLQPAQRNGAAAVQ